MSHCIHCGVARSYYFSNEHASRKSCRKSKSGYHDFSGIIYYYFISKFFNNY